MVGAFFGLDRASAGPCWASNGSARCLDGSDAGAMEGALVQVSGLRLPRLRKYQWWPGSERLYRNRPSKMDEIAVTGNKAKEAFAFVQKSSYRELREKAQENELDAGFLLKCDEMLDTYASPRNFMAWNEYMKICLLAGCAKSMERSFSEGDIRGAIASITFRSAILSKACARYVSEQIIESFAQTSLPELPPEVIEVLPYVHLMLPRNTVYDAEGDEVISIMVQSGSLYANELCEESRAVAETFFPSEKLAPQELMGAEGLQIITFTKTGMDVFQEFITPDAKSWHESNVKATEESKYKSANTEKIIRIAVNSLLVHLYEPELVTTDPRPATKGIGFSGNSKIPLSPTWIGKAFRNASERRCSKAEDSTRGNVRSHWRRGHWHSVCIGPKRSERRVQWFKPVYVNPSLELS